jgi:hypothetical protein
MADYQACGLCGLRNALSLQHLGCARHLGYPDACEVRVRDKTIAGLRSQLAAALKTVEAADKMHASIKPASPRGLDGEIEGYEEARAELARVMGADGKATTKGAV